MAAAVAAAGPAIGVVSGCHDKKARYRIGVAGLSGLHRRSVPGQDLVVRRVRRRQPRGVRLRQWAVSKLLWHRITVGGVVGVGDSCETCPVLERETP